MTRHLDNIVALATPQGNSALALIRISGSNLNKIYHQLTKKKTRHRLATHCKIYHPKNSTLIDSAIVTFFKQPRSFTGEDIIEISCHGGTIVSKNIIEAIITCGARYADPGEFSLRAFYNGKMDLLQAEAINQIINSNNMLSNRAGLEHLTGLASKKINSIKEDAINILTIVENELNFSENEINITTEEKIKIKLLSIKKSIEQIINDSLFGSEIQNGYNVVLVGKPNAGKSSLFNRILAKERAIVSSQKGTTRDSIEANLNINGKPITLIDTAGIWEAKNDIDKQSVNKTIKEIKKAHICIVLDENNPSNILKLKQLKDIAGEHILVQTKQDNFLSQNTKDVIITSSKNNIGINKLLTRLSTLLTKKDKSLSPGTIFIAARQRALLEEGLIIIKSAINMCEKAYTTDIIASTIKSFTLLLEELIGKIHDKTIINKIFSEFCIGK